MSAWRRDGQLELDWITGPDHWVGIIVVFIGTSFPGGDKGPEKGT